MYFSLHWDFIFFKYIIRTSYMLVKNKAFNAFKVRITYYIQAKLQAKFKHVGVRSHPKINIIWPQRRKNHSKISPLIINAFSFVFDVKICENSFQANHDADAVKGLSRYESFNIK